MNALRSDDRPFGALYRSGKFLRPIDAFAWQRAPDGRHLLAVEYRGECIDDSAADYHAIVGGNALELGSVKSVSSHLGGVVRVTFYIEPSPEAASAPQSR
jgi:hypothetical protein